MPNTLRAATRTLIALALLGLLGQAVPALSQKAAGAEGPPYRVGEGISRPEILLTTRPEYTELARRARISGVVVVEAAIDEQGNVTKTRVLKGLPMGLSQAALDAVQTWKFKPATREGKSVPVYYVLTVNFRADGSPSSDGTMFVTFLEQSTDFAALLRGRRFEEASELLDGWAAERPKDSAIQLARIHLLLEENRLQDAWQKALADHGPERYEALCSVGAFAWKQAQRDAEGRAETIELGLQAETAAMATNPDAFRARIDKAWLLRSKAELTQDPKEHQALIEEADRLRKQATAGKHLSTGPP
jgi:TonB family protein